MFDAAVPLTHHKYLAKDQPAPSASELGTVPLPKVFSTPVRIDLVERVHDLLMKNTRQPVARMHKAGTLSSNKSWHTGRAKARVTRIKASGTTCSGSGARANFCRGGGMFHALTLNKRIGRPVNRKERRHAIRSAIAASANHSLVQARGHIIEKLAYIPCVVSDDVESITKTKEAVEVLRATKTYSDVLKCINSKTMRAGQGKMRGRKYKMKRGPLVVFKTDNGISRAFRNVPGVSLMSVDSPNLLKLAPGGSLGRLIIWTKSAFESLDSSLGGEETFMRPNVANTCLKKVLKSEVVQSAASALVKTHPTFCKSSYHSSTKVNPLRSLAVMNRLNKYNQLICKKYKHVMKEISLEA